MSILFHFALRQASVSPMPPPECVTSNASRPRYHSFTRRFTALFLNVATNFPMPLRINTSRRADVTDAAGDCLAARAASVDADDERRILVAHFLM